MLPLRAARARPASLWGTPPGAPPLKGRAGRPPATVPLLGRAGPGRVLWSRTAAPGEDEAVNAAWLRLPDGVVGLAPRGAPLGPRWICRPEPWPALVDGQPVLLDGEGLHTGSGILFLDGARGSGWLGPLPDHEALVTPPARALVSEALASCRPTTLLSEPWFSATREAVETVGRLPPLDALRTVARALGGLGPGLTPAGDDALCGILFAFRAMGGPPAEPALMAVARSVHTGDVSAPLLEAAAAGCSIEPVHDLVMAAAAGDRPAAGRASAELASFGSSSGADLGFGLRLAVMRR